MTRLEFYRNVHSEFGHSNSSESCRANIQKAFKKTLHEKDNKNIQVFDMSKIHMDQN